MATMETVAQTGSRFYQFDNDGNNKLRTQMSLNVGSGKFEIRNLKNSERKYFKVLN